jgi:phosphatidate phosphatase APP1
MQSRYRNIAFLLAFAGQYVWASEIKLDETVVLFPTNAYLQENNWQVDIHGWVFEYERDSLWRNASVHILLEALELDHRAMESEYFKQRAWMFLVDSERRKAVTVRVAGASKTAPPSDTAGHFSTQLSLSSNRVSAKTSGRWQQIEVRLPDSDPRRFVGQVQFVPPRGVSVISDIDDTIKISEVNDKQALLENTFLKPFQAVPHMPAVYQRWAARGAAFHYVSAAPWQLYQPLHAFFVTAGFPLGSVQLRDFNLVGGTFFNLFESSIEYKTQNIVRLFEYYPNRQFVLVGDSSENDAHIYTDVATRFPKQVLKILIRDVDGHHDLAHFKKIFAELADEQWIVFRDASDLSSVNLPIR